jgi:hypothetical protein
MLKLARAATRDGRVIAWAHDVVRYVPERDDDATARAFLDWTRGAFRYTKDPEGREAIKTPRTMLEEYERHGRIVGDCDEQVTLLLAGLATVGIPAEPVVMSQTLGDYSHVYMRYWSGQRGWVAMDPIVRGTDPGWMPQGASRVASCTVRGGCVELPPRQVQGLHGALPPPGVIRRRRYRGHVRPRDPFYKAARAIAPYIPLVYLGYVTLNLVDMRRRWRRRR